MTVSKDRYLQVFGIVAIILALYRCAFPDVARQKKPTDNAMADSTETTPVDTITTATILKHDKLLDKTSDSTGNNTAEKIIAKIPHRIFSVPSFKDCFPDSQNVHLEAAKRWGVKTVSNRHEAEERKQELVYVGANPYYHVDNLKSSIPYLVPRASKLLNTIGRQYFDSLYVKNIPLHKIIISSVMRTKDDLEKLRRRNGNATENSCHLYGTTIDICYNRYQTVYDPRKGERRAVSNDTLKWVLAEVLRDVREKGLAYIKYEKKQGCFHITVR